MRTANRNMYADLKYLFNIILSDFFLFLVQFIKNVLEHVS